MIQEDPVGVKWTWKQGCLASHVSISAVLRVARVVVAYQVHIQLAGTALPIVIRNFLNSIAGEAVEGCGLRSVSCRVVRPRLQGRVLP